MSAENYNDDVENPNRFSIDERFLKRPALNAVLDFGLVDQASHVAATIANPVMEVSGTNATTALVTFSAGGGITLTTAGASGDQMIVGPQSNTNQSAIGVAGQWVTDAQVIFDATIKTGASIAAATIIAGLKKTSTPVIATDDDQVYFRYEPSENGGKFQLISSRAGVDSTLVSNVTVAASTIYRLRIEIDSNRKVTASINGASVTANKLNALETAVNLYPFVGVEASAAAAKSIDVKRMALSRVYS